MKDDWMKERMAHKYTPTIIIIKKEGAVAYYYYSYFGNPSLTTGNMYVIIRNATTVLQ